MYFIAIMRNSGHSRVDKLTVYHRWESEISHLVQDTNEDAIDEGYIDEKYANSINYFKGESITINDMNFMLSVKNMEPEPFDYILAKISMVVRRLQ